jgi:hypothetical protein
VDFAGLREQEGPWLVIPHEQNDPEVVLRLGAPQPPAGARKISILPFRLEA